MDNNNIDNNIDGADAGDEGEEGSHADTGNDSDSSHSSSVEEHEDLSDLESDYDLEPENYSGNSHDHNYYSDEDYLQSQYSEPGYLEDFEAYYSMSESEDDYDSDVEFIGYEQGGNMADEDSSESDDGENNDENDDNEEALVAGNNPNDEAEIDEMEVRRRVLRFTVNESLRQAEDLPVFQGGFMPASAPSALENDQLDRNVGVSAPAPNVTTGTDAAANEGDDEAKAPPEKKARMDSSSGDRLMSNLGEPDGCIICAESYTNCGAHMLCCLKCGHMFGKSCIEKWLGKHKTCPNCISKATKKDIRILYAASQNISVADTQTIEDLRTQLKQVEMERHKMRLDDAILRSKLEIYEMEVKRLKATIAALESGSTTKNLTGPSNSHVIVKPEPIPAIPSTSRGIPGRKSCRFQLCKQFEIKEGPCRVSAFNDEMNMLVVSHEIKNSLYPAGCGAIKQFNLLEMRPSVSLPIHQKQIRDMAFSLNQTNFLLTVSLDKKAVLFNCSTNVPVQNFQTECPLWSCCWDEIKRYMFYVGTHNGQIILFDIRTPSEPVATFSVPSGDTSPVCRLKFVTPAYQSSSFKMTGLIVQKLNSIWFCELHYSRDIPEPRFHQLPLEGPFVNVDFEPISRHMLVSTRPSARNQNNNCVHYLCNLVQVYSEAVGANQVTTHIVRTYQGGSRGAQKMCRSIIFSPEQGYVYACANGSMNNAVKMWDISLSESDCRLIAPVTDVIIDFVRGPVNGKNYLSLISEKGVSIFEEIFE